MKEVQPIRDKTKIEDIKIELLKTGMRNYMIFVLGINTGLRIGDLLKLKVEDVRDKTHVIIKEQKTGKNKRFMINYQLKKEIENYIKNMNDNEYLFQSQKGVNKPVGRVQTHRILKGVSQKVGLEEISNHSMRKTFGYFHYKQYKDVALLQNLFNHSSPSVVLRYVGINQDIMDKTIEDFYL